MFRDLFFITEDIKKDKVQVPQRNEMLNLNCTVFVFLVKMKNINYFVLYYESN